jgi:hypothetical protein
VQDISNEKGNQTGKGKREFNHTQDQSQPINYFIFEFSIRFTRFICSSCITKLMLHSQSPKMTDI